MKRYPHGIDGEVFFQKQAPKHLPNWIPTRQFTTHPRGSKGESRLVDFALVNSTDAVLFMVQNNCIDMNAWYSRVDKPRPAGLRALRPRSAGGAGRLRARDRRRASDPRAARRGRAAGLREDERRRRHPRRRADHAPLDVPADVRLRRAGVAAARGAASRPPHDAVAEEEARGRARRPPAERSGQDDRVRLLGAAEAGRAGVDAASLGRVAQGLDAARLHDGRRARARRKARRPVRARARGSAPARAGGTRAREAQPI